MKKAISIFISILLTIGLCGAVVYANSSPKDNLGARENFPHINNPEPIYKANKDKPKEAFLSNEDILKIIDKNQVKTKNSKVQSIKTVTWQEHLTKDEPNNKVKLYTIDNNRVVSVVNTYFPDGLDTKAGFYANATLTSVYDSETGELIESSITGDYKGKIQ